MTGKMRTNVSRHFNNARNIVANGKMFEVLFRNELRKIITAILSQGILSVSNFVIGILMAKYASKSEYGMYVVLFSFIGILGGYQGGLINAPLMALVNTKKEEEKRIYVSSLSAGKNFLFVPVLFINIFGNDTVWFRQPRPGLLHKRRNRSIPRRLSVSFQGIFSDIALCFNGHKRHLQD